MTMKLAHEELLEPLARVIRFQTAICNITSKKPITIVDLGCARDIPFYYFLKKNHILIKNYVGIDPLLNTKMFNHKHPSNIKLINTSLNRKISLNNNVADYVVALAFLEHIDNPRFIINESIRILKKGGLLIVTTPSPKAKSILEFMAEKLRLLSRREINEHKNYFDKKSLVDLIDYKNIVTVKHHYFELGLNNLFIVTKNK